MTSAASPSSRPLCKCPTSPEAAVHTSALPRELADLVLSVTRRCRLWKRERAEIALDLCAHLQDALDAGVPVPTIIADFGDPARAAALLTPAKKRLRPLWWRALRQTLRTSAALIALSILFYALAVARFFLGAPSITRNYMNEMNAPVLATPVAQRAWPRYIDALREFGPLPDFLHAADAPNQPGDPDWDKYVAWIRLHEPGLSMIRDGASRPQLGYVLQNDLDPDLVKVMEANNPSYKHSPAPAVENPLVVGILLPHLGEMRKMTRWLGVDMHAAAAEHDRARFIADTRAMLGMAEQCLPGPHVISSLVGAAILDHARAAVQAHALDDGFLTDDDLRTLAHLFAAVGGGRLTVDTTAERYTIDDILQRFYSDDGHGDGRYIKSPELEKMYDDFGVIRPKGLPLLKAYQPIESIILPSRRAMTDLADRFADRAAVDESLPPWRHDERTADDIFNKIGESGIYSMLPIIQALQGGQGTRPLAHAFAARDLAAARRDALLVIIALELHHRRHHAYPASLDQLVPGLLPAVPLDPMDGRPLRYIAPASHGARPILYSVGCDGVDDQGAPPATRGGRSTASSLTCLADYRRPRVLTSEEQTRLDAGRGDWILWPEPAPAPD